MTARVASRREHLRSIEPLYDVNYLEYARLSMATGRLDESEKFLRIAEELSQPVPYLHMVAALLRGDADRARAIATQAPSNWRHLNMALAAQIGPDGPAADTALATVLQDKVAPESQPFRIAQIYALRGDAGNTVKWLERATIPYKLFLLTDPLVLRLRDDPHFIAFCKRTGLAPPSESEARSIDQIRVLLSNGKRGQGHLPRSAG